MTQVSDVPGTAPVYPISPDVPRFNDYWALHRFTHLETLGFDYGQRHAIELACRDRLLDGFKDLREDWAGKLGESHTLSIPTLASISDTRRTGTGGSIRC